MISALAVCAAVAAAACGSDPPPVGPGPTNPVQITCPATIERESVSGEPLTVVFDLPAVKGGKPPVSTTCTPAPGTQFTVGTTRVVCVAQDTVFASASCSFDVVVKGTPRLSLTKFVAFGDSLTYGLIAPSAFTLVLDQPQSYPAKLQGLLQDRYRGQTMTVVNDGVQGEQAYDAAQRRFGSMLRVHRPQAVLLMEGANDLIHYQSDAFERAIPALESMVIEAQSHDVKVFLATIPPQRPDGARHRGAVARLIPAFNSDVKAIATRRSNAIIVDVEAAILKDMSLVGNDDLHLTERGYFVVAQTFFDAIKKALEVQPSPTPLTR